ncbi:unnamed protein product [Protopolystoma xenopodis]|uniref:Uncharacterized protein n=1 Tax=Protopolystoma xenopodis TaxID=117903 RepID=A0A448WZI2_9PLAT|nr:unnamed protein product [Protopolystoma xenopodis]
MNFHRLLEDPPTHSVRLSDTEGDRHTEVERLARLIRRICLADLTFAGETQLRGILRRVETINRVHVDALLAEARPPPETASRTRRLVYLHAQKIYLFLGDLTRYAQLIAGTHDFGKSRRYPR